MSYGMFTACSYDVWGNEKDGYEVNNVFPFERDVVIQKEVYENLDNEKELIRFIKRLFGLKKNLRFDNFEFDGDFDCIIFINYNGYPIGELRCDKVIEEAA